jgi:hypothetical protein
VALGAAPAPGAETREAAIDGETLLLGLERV